MSALPPAVASAVLIRPLVASDAGAYKALRDEALRTAPDAFTSDYESSVDRDASEYVARFGTVESGQFFLGAFDAAGQLVGCLGCEREQRTKQRHLATLVGMTNVPEAFLAREAQMAYATLAIATDYDCWREDPEEHAHMEAIMARYAACLEQARALIGHLAAGPQPEPEPAIRRALQGAVMTDESLLDEAQRAWLSVLRS